MRILLPLQGVTDLLPGGHGDFFSVPLSLQPPYTQKLAPTFFSVFLLSYRESSLKTLEAHRSIVTIIIGSLTSEIELDPYYLCLDHVNEIHTYELRCQSQIHMI